MLKIESSSFNICHPDVLSLHKFWHLKRLYMSHCHAFCTMYKVYLFLAHAKLTRMNGNNFLSIILFANSQSPSTKMQITICLIILTFLIQFLLSFLFSPLIFSWLWTFACNPNSHKNGVWKHFQVGKYCQVKIGCFPFNFATN